MKSVWAISIFCITLCSAHEPDDCTLKFKGKARKAVKMRTKQSGVNYEKIDNGDTISVERWIELTCELDENVPDKIPSTKSIVDVENKKVAIRGFLLGAKYEGGGDQDIHAEISDDTNWNSDHIVIEIPPGEAYCNARKNLWRLVKDDPAPLKNHKKILKDPIEVIVTGYIFLDANHGKENRCESNGGRGIRKGKNGKSRVVGLYEVHPVLSLEAAN